MRPPRTAPPRPAGPWVLTVKFNVHLIPPGEGGALAVSTGRALTLCFRF